MHDAEKSTDMTPGPFSNGTVDTAIPKLKREGVFVARGAKGDGDVVLCCWAQGHLTWWMESIQRISG